MNVLFHFEMTPGLEAEIRRQVGEDITVLTCDQDDDATFFELLPDIDCLWHVLRPITADVIARAPKLKLIQKIGVGVNTIDLEAARAAGVHVCNMPGTNTRAVAEMTLLLILATLRRLPHLHGLVRSGSWVPDAKTTDSFGELAGRTVGLIGFGGVASLLAPILEAMGAKIIYWSRMPKDTPYAYGSFEDVLAQADILSLHIPLTDDTAELINANRLARMKRGAILINTARGGLVDEDALVQALASGQIAGAGLDVFADEPASAANPLLHFENVVLAPHAAWLTTETLSRSIEAALHNTRAIASGTPLRHQIV